jgi:hypothetical protein
VTLTAHADQQRLPGGTLARNLDATVRLFTDPSGWQVARVEHATAKLAEGEARLTGNVLLDTLDTLHLSHLAQTPCNVRLDLRNAGIAWNGLVKSGHLTGAIAATKFASASGHPLPDWFVAASPAGGAASPSAPVHIASVSATGPSVPAPLVLTGARLDLPRPGEAPPSQTAAEVTLAAGGAAGRPARYGAAPSLPAPDLDLSLALGPRVRIDNRVLQGDIAKNDHAVSITGTPQAPTVHAELALTKGTLNVLRGSLRIMEGGAEADLRPAPTEPTGPGGRAPLALASHLWGRAEGTVNAAVPTTPTTTATVNQPLEPVRVTLELSGGLPPDQTITATSSPSYTQSEVLNLLALGPVQPGGSAPREGGQSANQLVASVLSQQLFQTVVSPLEQQISTALGLSEFSLQVGLDQPFEVRVGKYLVKGLLLSYRRTAGTVPDRYDLDLTYEVRPNYSVTFHTDELEGKDIRFEYRWRF